MNVAYSLSSGALGAVVVIVAWILSHAKQISSVLAMLPTVQKDVEAARLAIEKHLAPTAVPAPTPAPTAAAAAPTAAVTAPTAAVTAPAPSVVPAAPLAAEASSTS
jgi:hypothetical protein